MTNPATRPPTLLDDVMAATAVPSTETPALEKHALQGLLNERAIRNLATVYALVRDDHDIDALIACFAGDGSFINDGHPVQGHDALRKFYVGNMERHAFSLHIPNSHVIWLDGPDRARGVVTGHGEFAGSTSLQVCAYRYDDEYVRVDDRWVFASRAHDFVYYLPVDELSTVGRDEFRLARADGTRERAEWLPGPVPAAAAR